MQMIQPMHCCSCCSTTCLFLYNLNDVVVIHLMTQAHPLWTVLYTCTLQTQLR